MQENKLFMKNIKTKVKTTQKILVENLRFLKSAQSPQLKLIAKEMNSFVINPNPILIWPRYVMELSIAFLVKIKASNCANPPFLKLLLPKEIDRGSYDILILATPCNGIQECSDRNLSYVPNVEIFHQSKDVR